MPAAGDVGRHRHEDLDSPPLAHAPLAALVGQLWIPFGGRREDVAQFALHLVGAGAQHRIGR
jgi:hypothetical protein